MKIGFIGLGSMGLQIATVLIRAGHELIVWNRSPAKCTAVIALGAQRAERPADAAAAKFVITMVANDSALEEVVHGPDGFGEHLGKGAVHISMSTVSPEVSRQLNEFHHQRGASFVAAPVFGGPANAKDGSLFVLCAGEPSDRAQAIPILECVGQKIFVVGDVPARANVLKLAGNFMVMAAIEAMSEAFTLAERYGISRQTAYETLTQSIFPDSVYANFGARIAAHSYTPVRFKLSLGLKDVSLALDAASDVNLPMPAASLMHQRYLTAMSKGRQDIDWTAVAIGASEDGGLSVPD